MTSIKHIYHVHQQIHLIHQEYHVHHQRSMHVHVIMHVLPLLTSLHHSIIKPMHHMHVHVLMRVHIIHHTHKP